MGKTYKADQKDLYNQTTDKQAKLSKKEQGKKEKQFFRNWSAKA